MTCPMPAHLGVKSTKVNLGSSSLSVCLAAAAYLHVGTIKEFLAMASYQWLRNYG